MVRQTFKNLYVSKDVTHQRVEVFCQTPKFLYFLMKIHYQPIPTTFIKVLISYTYMFLAYCIVVYTIFIFCLFLIMIDEGINKNSYLLCFAEQIK